MKHGVMMVWRGKLKYSEKILTEIYFVCTNPMLAALIFNLRLHGERPEFRHSLAHNKIKL
jgi:hypothetical protein